MLKRVRVCAAGVAALSLLALCDRVAAAGNLRIVDWNVEADVNGVTTPRAGLSTVLQGLGNEIANAVARPLDVLALEETTSNATTVAPIVTSLNAIYGAGTYAMSTYQATESGNDPTTGNGPNALVYNTKTVTLINSVGVGTPTGSTNGEYRQVVRYALQPIGGSTPFYVYVSHMKSGSTSADATARGKEAAIIRADELTLPANASVIYAGDLNSAPPEAEFTNFTAAGQGQAADPVNFSTSLQYYSESSTDLRYRDDYQLMTSDILNGTGAINYVSGTLRSFANNGTIALDGSVTDSSNTALAYMTAANGYSPTRSQIFSALTTASDHLPVVADFTFATPEPIGVAWMSAASYLLLNRRRAAR